MSRFDPITGKQVFDEGNVLVKDKETNLYRLCTAIETPTHIYINEIVALDFNKYY